MAKVEFKRLNIRRSRGKWYVAYRPTGENFVKGFEGSKGDLLEHLASPEVMQAYLAAKAKGRERVVDPKIVEQLFDWFMDEGNEAWAKLTERTRNDYRRVITWCLKHGDSHAIITSIRSSDIVKVRKKAAAMHGAKFGAYVVAVLSSVFGSALEEGHIDANPAQGVKKGYKPNRGANRRWQLVEWRAVIETAPDHLKPAYALARYAGLRTIDIQPLLRSAYVDDDEFGKAISFVASKNGMHQYIPLPLPCIAILEAAPKDAVTLCQNSHGRPWKSENALRKACLDHIGKLRKKDLVGPGLTMHGLRGTLASIIKEHGFDNRAVSNVIGDESESMGAHYSRHAIIESNVRDVMRTIRNVE